jgi:hypothetical protein
MASLYYVLLLLLLATLVPCAPILPELATDNTTSYLERRQCVWNDKTSAFDCDMLLPTIPELVARMRDLSDSGAAGPASRVVFYSNLIEGEPNPASLTTMWVQIAAYAKAHKLEPWYGASAPLNPDWYNAQLGHIVANEDAFDTKYGNGVKGEAQLIFGGCFSQALAYAASVSQGPLNAGLAHMSKYEDAYFFTPDDHNWLVDSVWQKAE